MESLTPVSRYKSQNSKKRVFSGGSSSSGYEAAEVLESPPPINSTYTPKPSKQKEVIVHEMMDMDTVEDYEDLIFADEKVDSSGKGKEVLSNYSSNGSLTGSDLELSDDGVVDDPNSNTYHDEEEWIETYYDDILYDDDDKVMESHFDHMEIPPGVEAPVPWFPGHSQNNPNDPTTNTSTSSNSQNGASSSGPEYQSLASSAYFFPPKPAKDPTKSLVMGKTRSSTSIALGYSSSKNQWNSSSNLTNIYSNKSGYHQYPSFPAASPGVYCHNNVYPCPSGPANSPFIYGHNSGYPYPSLPANLPAINSNNSGYQYQSMPTNTPGMGTDMPAWQEWDLDMMEPSPVIFSGSVSYPPAQHSANVQTEGTPFKVDKEKLDEILQNFKDFKKFDTVEDYSDHHYCKYGYSGKQAPKGWAKSIQEEWKILEKNLPDMIFVRVYESRMDLLRAVIIGAEGTPYHDGLFFFDLFFPANYPDVPPHVYYHSGGLRINPNLYNCGKVCLSLLNTWPGNSPKEKWVRGVSTILQVLVSIQGLILNSRPYFNEPGYEGLSGTKHGEKKSSEYSEKTFMHSLQTMVYTMRRPPKYFEDFVVGHFCKCARDILLACSAYSEGAEVGSIIKGKVRKVEEGQKSSKHLKTMLAGFITTLVNTFSQIGAKGCEEFLHLAKKSNKPAAATS